MHSHPRVGIAVFVVRNKKFLMLKRKGSHGEGTWSVPGGHLEFGESFEDTARREVLEETGLQISEASFCGLTNDYFKDEDKHYVTIWMFATSASGEPQILEPEKCTDMGWSDLDTLPSPLFLPWQQLLQSNFIETIRKRLS